MSMNIPPERQYIYHDEIPPLRRLLPSTGGVPGVEYAQILIKNKIKARDEYGWGRMRDAEAYTIVGPKGEAHCELLCKGKPVPGQGTKSGTRVCWIDPEIYEVTGIVDPDAPAVVTKPKPKPAPVKPTEASQPTT